MKRKSPRIFHLPDSTPKRTLFGWLNHVFNHVDERRIQEVGPDMAAAEWILRCGGGVRFVSHPSTTRDYNILSHAKGGAKIESIDATESCVMSLGFPYLRGLTEVKEMKLVHCPYLDDNALAYLVDLPKLEHLELISCGNVTAKGIDHVKKLKQLKSLVLFDLPEVDRDQMMKDLQAAMPNCRIEYRNAEVSSWHSRR